MRLAESMGRAAADPAIPHARSTAGSQLASPSVWASPPARPTSTATSPASSTKAAWPCAAPKIWGGIGRGRRLGPRSGEATEWDEFVANGNASNVDDMNAFSVFNWFTTNGSWKPTSPIRSIGMGSAESGPWRRMASIKFVVNVFASLIAS